jgi:hypothetical protein
MIDAWVVIRQERHQEDRYWVCLQKADALKIATELVVYWREKYLPEQEVIDEELYGDQVFHFSAEDCFRVVAKPIFVREPCEHSALGEH